MDSLHSTFSAVPVGYLITGLLAAGARFIVSKEAPTLKRVIETVILSMAVIFAAYPYLIEREYSGGVLNLVIALISFAAKDILEFIIKLFNQLKDDPLSILRDFLNRVRPGGGQ